MPPVAASVDVTLPLAAAEPVARGPLRAAESSPQAPGKKPHNCTDISWLLVFVAAFVSFVGLYLHVVMRGDFRRLINGSDYLGRICGVETPGEFVFWCKRVNSTSLEMRYPLCISECPTSAETVRSCVVDDAGGAVAVPDYVTRQHGAYCVPVQARVEDRLVDFLAGQGAHTRLDEVLTALDNGRWAIVVATVFAALVGGLYLALLARCARFVMYLGLCPFFAVPFWSGRSLIVQAYDEYKDGIQGEDFRATKVVAGCGLLIVGALTFMCACMLAKRLREAVKYIRVSGECMLQEHGLLIQPLFDLFIRCVIIAAFIPSIALLLSSGVVGERGLRKHIDFSRLPLCSILYHVFFLMWSLEVCTAISQYVTVWVTHAWYFLPYTHGSKRDVLRLGIAQALYSAVRYHFGTMLLGSLLTMLLRVPRMLTSRCASPPQDSDEEYDDYSGGYSYEPQSGRSGRFHRFLARLQTVKKDAYMDVALNSSSFCDAASSTHDHKWKHHSIVRSVRVSQWIFVLTGYVVITWAGAFSASIFLRNPLYSEEESAAFISDPWVVIVAAGTLSFMLAFSWMTVFDTIGDTILYCYTIDQSRKETRRQAVREVERRLQLQREEEEQSTWLGWLVGTGKHCVFPDNDDDDDWFDDEAGYTPKALHEVVGAHRGSRWVRTGR